MENFSQHFISSFATTLGISAGIIIFLVITVALLLLSDKIIK